MKDHKTFFKGKNITVMGLGLLGRQINIAKFLAECDANLLVTDLKEKKELEPALEELGGFDNIEYHFGGHRLEDFRGKDMIIKAAGVPLDSPYIEEARNNNTPIEMDASLFLKLAPKDIVVIGVTGTRGKSTVTRMIASILEDAKKKIFIGGNIRGVATLPILAKATPGTHLVLELDSWQLQGFGEAEISPHIAVFTNFMSDHLNYYKGDIKRYFDDKSYIFDFQTEEDSLILGPLARKAVDEMYYGELKQSIFDVDETYLPDDVELLLPGVHNRLNAALALKVAELVGISKEDATSTLSEFESVSGRLERVETINGIDIYNDTNSTTPDALSTALRSFPDKEIVLIAGGTNKRLSYTDVVKEIEKRVKKLVLLPGTSTERMKRYLTNGFIETDDINEAVKIAFESAEEGDILLFSPGAASFGLFNNEYDRGDQFLKAVDQLTQQEDL